MNTCILYLNEPLPYALGVEIQERLVRARIEDAIPDTVLFLEHEPVITLGRRARDEFLLQSRDELAKKGVHVAVASRGGDVTYHGPGQLVMYPILRLGTHEADAHGYLQNLEQIAIRTAAAFGVDAFLRDGMNGAWTEQGKMAAIGFRLSRWVTSHGMSFNVDLDLHAFDWIVGCGLVGEKVSSMKNVLEGACPSLADVRGAMTTAFSEVCGRTCQVYMSVADLPPRIAAVLPDSLQE